MIKRFLIVFILFFSSLIAAKPLPLNDPVRVKKGLEDLQIQIKKYEKAIYHSQSEEKALTSQLALLEKSIGEKTDQIHHLKEKVAQHYQAFRSLQAQAKHLQTTHQSHQLALSYLIQATFKHYHKERLKLLLASRNGSTLSRFNQYYEYFYHARIEKINHLQNHLKEIQLLKQETHQEQQVVEMLLAKIQKNQNELIEKKETRETVLASLHHDRAGIEKALLRTQQEAAHLQQLFKMLQKKLPPRLAPEFSQHFANMKHQLPSPIQPPHAQKRNAKNHIQAKTGTPVTAIFPGRIVFAEWLRGIGLLMVIDHGNGYMSLYGNNQSLYKGIGDWVQQGEIIARVGQSGGQSEPGLYFEIRKDGQPLDLNTWLKMGV